MGSHGDCCKVNRRNFLGASTAAASLAAFATAGSVTEARAQLTQERRDAMTPDEIISRMLAGNERFVSGERKPRDFLVEQEETASGQFPAAVALSCIDSRAPVEVICDLGIGDTFNARVAGNISNDDILGSMEFACAVAGAKLAVVMGHTACGAVRGAIDNVELGHLTGLLAQIRPAIGETDFDGDKTGSNPAYVDAVARTNVLLTVKNIREESSILRELEEKGEIKIVGSMYDLKTGRITMLN
ncbi:carbonic anhydrase family protein [Methyloceanibacter sp.]|uniref:carbonic anhydrase family protein n=1 Tax=Methyloceanibacter sp. TaxID=1965321 RepID=UPI002C26CC5C|nr:carbonic anhydrase family protein [Methyloceanibacter sp.]HML90776.1 carbonic anhydrase family protein [Methyloceanibacter sp.]